MLRTETRGRSVVHSLRTHFENSRNHKCETWGFFKGPAHVSQGKRGETTSLNGTGFFGPMVGGERS